MTIPEAPGRMAHTRPALGQRALHSRNGIRDITRRSRGRRRALPRPVLADRSSMTVSRQGIEAAGKGPPGSKLGMQQRRAAVRGRVREAMRASDSLRAKQPRCVRGARGCKRTSLLRPRLGFPPRLAMMDSTKAPGLCFAFRSGSWLARRCIMLSVCECMRLSLWLCLCLCLCLRHMHECVLSGVS